MIIFWPLIGNQESFECTKQCSNTQKMISVKKRINFWYWNVLNKFFFLVKFYTKNNSYSSRAITSAWWASIVWSGFSESFLISHRSKWWSSPTNPKRWSWTACHATSSTGPSWYYISNKSYHNINEYLTTVIKKKRTQHLIQLHESPTTHTFLANREKLHSMNTRAERSIMISLVERST